MATSRSFQTMLNDYLNTDILRSELPDRMFMLTKVDKDNSWVSANGTQGYVVPFMGGQASSICFGSLTAAGDVSEDTDVRGVVTTQPEVWGTLFFNSKDFMQHEGKKREVSFLGSIKKQVPAFLDNFKMMFSDILMSGPHFCTVTGLSNAAGGICEIDHIEKVQIKQKILIREAATPSCTAGYIQAINKNTGSITLTTDRAGTVVFDLTVAGPLTAALLVGDRFYYDGLVNTATGALQNQFTTVRSSLLSLLNGGSATLYGQTKTAYPFLQAQNVNAGPGATYEITAANIVQRLFEINAKEMRTKTKAVNGKRATDYLLSSTNYAAAMIALEDYKGQFFTQPGKAEAAAYAWDNVTLGARSGGKVTLFEVPELDDDIIPLMNWDSWVLASNGFFKFQEDPNNPGGIYYYPVRATTGLSYYVDVAFMGDLICRGPESNGIIYGVDI